MASGLKTDIDDRYRYWAFGKLEDSVMHFLSKLGEAAFPEKHIEMLGQQLFNKALILRLLLSVKLASMHSGSKLDERIGIFTIRLLSNGFLLEEYWNETDRRELLKEGIERLPPALHDEWRNRLSPGRFMSVIYSRRANPNYFHRDSELIMALSPTETQAAPLCVAEISGPESFLGKAFSIPCYANRYDLLKFAGHLSSVATMSQVYFKPEDILTHYGLSREKAVATCQYVVTELKKLHYMSDNNSFSTQVYETKEDYTGCSLIYSPTLADESYRLLLKRNHVWRAYVLTDTELFYIEMPQGRHPKTHTFVFNGDVLLTKEPKILNKLLSKFKLGTTQKLIPLEEKDFLFIEQLVQHKRLHPKFIKTVNRLCRNYYWDNRKGYEFSRNRSHEFSSTIFRRFDRASDVGVSSFFNQLTALALFHQSMRRVPLLDQVVTKGIGVASKAAVENLVAHALEIAHYSTLAESSNKDSSHIDFIIAPSLKGLKQRFSSMQTGCAYVLTEKELHYINDVQKFLAGTPDITCQINKAKYAGLCAAFHGRNANKINEILGIVGHSFAYYALARKIATQFRSADAKPYLILQTGTPIKDSLKGSEHCFYILLERSGTNFRIVIFNGGGDELRELHSVEKTLHYDGVIQAERCYAATSIFLPLNEKFLEHYIYQVLRLPFLERTDQASYDQALANVYLSHKPDQFGKFEFSGFSNFKHEKEFREPCNDILYPMQWHSNCTIHNLKEVLCYVLGFRSLEAWLPFYDLFKHGTDCLITDAKRQARYNPTASDKPDILVKPVLCVSRVPSKSTSVFQGAAQKEVAEGGAQLLDMAL